MRAGWKTKMADYVYSLKDLEDTLHNAEKSFKEHADKFKGKFEGTQRWRAMYDHIAALKKEIAAKKAKATDRAQLHRGAFAKDSQVASWETMGGSSAYVDRTNKAYPILADVFRGDHNDEWVVYIHGRGLKLTKTFPTEAAAKQFVETKLQSRAKDSSQSLGRRARLHKALDCVLDGKAKK